MHVNSDVEARSQSALWYAWGAADFGAKLDTGDGFVFAHHQRYLATEYYSEHTFTLAPLTRELETFIEEVAAANAEIQARRDAGLTGDRIDEQRAAIIAENLERRAAPLRMLS